MLVHEIDHWASCSSRGGGDWFSTTEKSVPRRPSSLDRRRRMEQRESKATDNTRHNKSGDGEAQQECSAESRGGRTKPSAFADKHGRSKCAEAPRVIRKRPGRARAQPITTAQCPDDGAGRRHSARSLQRSARASYSCAVSVSASSYHPPNITTECSPTPTTA